MPERTVEQAAAECRAAWARHPEATWGWCILDGFESEPLIEPIEDYIAWLLSHEQAKKLICRLDNLRPIISDFPPSHLDDRPYHTVDEILADFAARRAIRHRADVPNHTWNGKSIFSTEASHES